MARIGILGMGAIGHLMAAQFLEKSGVQLHFLSRRPLRKFSFLSDEGKRTDQPIQTITQPEAVSLDWLLVCLKTYHYSGASNWFTEMIGAKTKVVVLRNGLDLGEPLLPYAEPSKILPCLVDAPTQYDTREKCYKLQAAAQLRVAEHPLAKPWEELLGGSEISVEIVRDFHTASWEKLIESAALGAITCLTGQGCHVFQDEHLRALYTKALQEGLEVARADGAQIEADYVGQLLEKLAGYPAEKGSSMLSDRLAGRPIEVMAKSGVISKKAEQLGVAAPLHSTFATLLAGINRS